MIPTEPLPTTSPAWPPRTWGLVIGLFTASLATLIGLASHVPPETILTRAAIGGAIVGVLARITAALAQTAPFDG